jgi:uncharacterized membrane protein YtjA (UPF0391 family)
MAAPVALLSRADCAAGNRIQQAQFVRRIACGRRQEPVPRSEVSVPECVAGRDAAPKSELAMTILKWALIFLLISIVAGVLGFTGISAASADIARFLFYVFVVIFLVLLILGLTIFRA